MNEATNKVPVKTGETTPERWPSLPAWHPIDGLRREMNQLVENFDRGFRRLPSLPAWHPVDSLRREMNQLIEDFDQGFRRLPFRRSMFEIEPFWRRELSWSAAPAVDIVEKDSAYEVIAELPGMDEKAIDVTFANGTLTIKGKKQEEKEETKKGYYVHERHFGSFERCFRVPEEVNGEKIEANFKGGVLTVILPKNPEAKKPEKKIEIKAG